MLGKMSFPPENISAVGDIKSGRISIYPQHSVAYGRHLENVASNLNCEIRFSALCPLATDFILFPPLQEKINLWGITQQSGCDYDFSIFLQYACALYIFVT
jgi:hypothetical protein